MTDGARDDREEEPEQSSSSSSSGQASQRDAATGADARPAEPEDALPTTPFFEVSINGTAMIVTKVEARGRDRDPEDVAEEGIAQAIIEVTLAREPAFLPGLTSDPVLTLRLGKDDEGEAACGREADPGTSLNSPVRFIREIGLSYKRDRAADEIYAFPTTTTAGGCEMNIKHAAADGTSWGEAAGFIESDSEPRLELEVKWLQTVLWK